MKKNSYIVPRNLHPAKNPRNGALLSRLTSSSSLPIRFLDNLDKLKNSLCLWGAENEVEIADSSEIELYLNWVQFQSSSHKEYAEDSEERIWAESDLYQGVGLLWEITFDECALRQLKAERQDRQIVMLQRLLELASGDIKLEENCVGVAISPTIVLFSVTETFNITVLLGPSDRARELVVIDILCKDAYTVYRNYLKKYREEFSEIREFDQVQFYRSVSVYIGPKIGPRAVDYKHSAQEPTQSSKMILDFLTRESNCKAFVSSLMKISSLKKDLTDEQQKLIGISDNVLAIGRSGTGKTTCSLLRIFATEMVHKAKAKREKSFIDAPRFTISDVDAPTELHSMFVTVSIYLTLEVKDMYRILREHTKQELREIEAKLNKTPRPPPLNITRHANFSIASMEQEKSLNLCELSDADFPVFATFDQLLKGVDGTLQHSFFVRQPGTNKLIPGPENLGVHRKVKGAYIVQGLGNPRPSFLVDYQYFLYNFWPRVRKLSGELDPAHVWFEIMAIIKGSGTSYCFTDFHMSRVLYLSHGKKRTILTNETKKRVWDIFDEYIRWKEVQGGYDAQDVANYVLYMIDLQGYHAASIHCLMIDEVQDLTPAMLLLLWRITEHQLFLSGDTAQTITKGAGFRFKDMNTISHYDSKFADRPPKMVQLKTSFRSHMQILNFANHIVSLIEIIFPKLIDKLDSEESPEKGPLPIFISEKSWLQGIFSGNVEEKVSEVTFGSNQVIIVRDEDAKDRIPHSLQQALCLSVLDCKGLEFCDVLIYDFFSTSPVKMKEWESLHSLYADLFDGLEKKIDKAALRVFLEKHPISLQYTLCNDLKMLYVAVTRTRKRLLFYESQPEKVAGLIELWANLRLTSIATSESEVLGFLQPTTVTSASAWLEQAEALMQRENFSEAAKCYRRAGKIREAFHAHTLSFAADGSNRLNRSVAAMDSTSSAADLACFQREKKSALTTLYIAAERFRLLGMKNQAGQCYFSAKRYDQAAMMFQECRDYRACAECYIHIDFYERAAFYYEICRDYEKAICCFDITADWSSALLCIQMHADIIPTADVESYVFHYFSQYCRAKAEEFIPSEPIISNFYIISSGLNEEISNLSPVDMEQQFAEEVYLPESELGQSLYSKIELHPVILPSVMSRAIRKSPSVLSLLWTPHNERAYCSEIQALFELLEVLSLPNIACQLAKDYRLLGVWQHCAVSLAHSLGMRSPIDAKQLANDTYSKTVEDYAHRAVARLKEELLGNSILREVSAGRPLRQALVTLGFLDVAIKIGEGEELIRQSLGICAMEDESLAHLFACISAKQHTHPICTSQCCWNGYRMPELHHIFFANCRFWDIVMNRRNPADFLDLVAYISATFETSVKANNLTSVADCSSTISLLLCWKEQPEKWEKMNVFAFHLVLKMTKLLIKAVSGSEVIRQMCFLSTWMAAIDGALAPFQVYRIPTTELTSCLPTLTHYTISRYSLLFPEVIEKCTNLPYYDLAGNWFLVPLEVVVNAVAVFLVKTLSSIVMERHSAIELLKDKHKLRYLLLDSNEKRRYQLSVLQVAKYADMYGEIGYLFSIQQLLADAYPLVATRRTKAFATKQHLHTEISQLKGMIDIDDSDDEEFFEYMKRKNIREINQLTKQMDEMRCHEFDKLCERLVYYTTELAFHFDWCVESYTMTKWGRKALLLDAVYDLECRPISYHKVLVYDRVFQACSRRSHFLWLMESIVGEQSEKSPEQQGIYSSLESPDDQVIRGIPSAIYPLESLQQGKLDVLAKWHLETARILKASDEVQQALQHLSLSFLFGWLQCREEVQCPNSLCRLLRTKPLKTQPYEHSRITQAGSSHRSTRSPPFPSSPIHYEVPPFSGFIDEQKGKDCLKQSLYTTLEWLEEVGTLKGSFKHAVWKYIYFTLYNAELEDERLFEVINEMAMNGALDMKVYIGYLMSSDHMAYVIEYITENRTTTDIREKLITICMSQQVRNPSSHQLPEENAIITKSFQSLDLPEPPKYSLRKLHYANSMGLDGLLTDESVDCLCFQQFALELVSILRHECANQREAQVVLKVMAEVQEAWTAACEKAAGDRLSQSQFDVAAEYVRQKKKQVEEWKRVSGKLPPWKDRRSVLPKKID